MSRVFVVQRPPRLDHFDIDALNALGEVEYLTPNAPNVQDPERIKADFNRMLGVLRDSKPDDVFLALGGSPITNWLFGAAIYASGLDALNVALYSRDQSAKGERMDTGRYRIIQMSTDLPEDA